MSRTLALLTPDVVAADKAAAIEELIMANSFAVLARLETTLSMQQAAEMFEEHEGKPFFSALCTFMSSGPLVALALEKADAIADWLALMGPDCVVTAKAEAPSSVRAVYGTDSIKKAAHGSASAAAAYRELKFFFPKTFPREATLTLVSKTNAALIDKAAAEGFLVIGQKTLEEGLTPEQAAAFVSVDEFSVDAADKAAKAAAISGAGPLIAALLEKPFAVESWLSMPAAAEAVHSSLSPTAAASEAVALFGAGAVETIEYTFAFVTPDAFANAPSILAIAEANGFTVMCSSSMLLSKDKAAAFGFAADAVDHMTSGPVLAMVLQRTGAVTAWKALLGPVEAKRAKESYPLSLRALFGADALKCAATGSESVAEAEKQAALFFPELAVTQTTLALLTPLPAMETAMHEALTAAGNAGLIVTQKAVTTLDEARATDFLALLGDACPPPMPPPPIASLFFSAFVPSSSILQIFNPTAEAICLDGYALGVQPAKKDSEPNTPEMMILPANKYVPAGGVFCVYHEDASVELKAMLPADEAHSMSVDKKIPAGFGIGLLKVIPGGFEVVDLLGDFTLSNKKQPWSVAGVPRATKEKTLLRKSTVATGNASPWTNPSKSSQGVCAGSSEWILLSPCSTELLAAGWTLASWAPSEPAPPPAAVGSYEAAVELLTSGPCVALALSGKGAVAKWNALLGPEDPLVAKVRCATCLRAKFGVDATKNVGHGSATAAAAFAEVKFFFPKTLVDPLPTNKEAQQYASEKLVPTLTAGLVELCALKPANPVEWLAQWLLENNPNTPKVYAE